MDTKFNFKSAICTSRSQSERLLALGLKKETADMAYRTTGKVVDMGEVRWMYQHNPSVVYKGMMTKADIPAWSLHRLIEMMPESLPTEMTGIQGLFHISRHSDMTFTVGYTWSLDMKGSLYDVMISAYEWLIKGGNFNKEYLV